MLILNKIIQLVSFLTDIEAEGIFRISGNKKRQEELKHLLDKDVEINFEQDNFTEHDVASVLKQFLAELPEPIITTAHIEIHMQVIGKEFAKVLLNFDYIVILFKQICV